MTKKVLFILDKHVRNDLKESIRNIRRPVFQMRSSYADQEFEQRWGVSVERAEQIVGHPEWLEFWVEPEEKS